MTDISEGTSIKVGKRPRDLSTLIPYLFILPAVAIMAVGLVYPVIQAFYLSFF